MVHPSKKFIINILCTSSNDISKAQNGLQTTNKIIASMVGIKYKNKAVLASNSIAVITHILKNVISFFI